jgi:two-component system, chemotaxis family, protein-glutamate methylesterase/glutaminase
LVESQGKEEGGGMSGHDVIVIGASAGGAEALTELVGGLPAELPAANFVVHHFPSHATSVLPSILNRAGSLHAARAREDGVSVPPAPTQSPEQERLAIRAGLPRSPFEVVAIAASAGGLRALSVVLSALPAHFPASVAVVQHLDPRHRSMMADILSRRTTLRVKQAEEGDRLTAAMVYIAPPNRHLLISAGGVLTLSSSELVHFVRPSADLLFESVADTFKERAIAVVLTGTGSDGSMGVRAVKKMGGTVIAQDEATAEFFGMPGAAIHTGCVDFVLPLDEIAGALVTLMTAGEGE